MSCLFISFATCLALAQRVKTKGPKPGARVGHSCVPYRKHELLFFGGFGAEKFWDDLHLLDLRSGMWQCVDVAGCIAPRPRTFTTMQIVEHRVMLFGGSNHDIELNDVAVFDLMTHEWNTVECIGQVTILDSPRTFPSPVT